MTTVLTVFAVLLSASLARGQSTGRPLDLASEVESLKKALAETQKQVTAQQREIEALKNGPKSATMPAENGQQSKPAVQAAPQGGMFANKSFRSHGYGGKVAMPAAIWHSFATMAADREMGRPTHSDAGVAQG